MRGRRFGIDWGEAIVPGIALVFGVAFFLQTTDAPLDALFWPLITAAAVLAFWLFTVKAFVFRHPSRQTDRPAWPATPSPAFGRSAGRVVLILTASVAYLLLIPHLGFSVTNFVFMVAVFRGLGSRRWVLNLVVAAGIALFLHLALVALMKLELPQLVIGGLAL